MGDSTGDDTVTAAIQAALQGPRRGRGAIDVLIPLLSPWELVYLRDRTRDIRVDPTQANGFATFLDVPVDILCILAEDLGPRDLLVFRRVSKAWKYLWMQTDVLRVILHNHFPGLLQLQPGEQDLERIFLQVMSRYQRKPRDMQSSAAIAWTIDGHRSLLADGHTLFPLFTRPVYRYPDGPVSPPLYSNGKVVWQPTSGEFVIDDLHSGNYTRCTTSPDPRSRAKGYGRPVALSKELLVLSGSIGREYPTMDTDRAANRTMHIYHLEHKTWKHVTLPEMPSWCYVNGETVVTSCWDGQAFIWSWDAILEELPVDEIVPPDSAARFEELPGALFHPTNPRVVFLVWVFSHDPKTDPFEAMASSLFTTRVARYERQCPQGWMVTARFQNTVGNAEGDSTLHDPRVNAIRLRASLTLSCEKIDTHGSYSVVTCCGYRTQLDKPGWRRYWLWRNHITQCFNVLTETFSHVSYREDRNLPFFDERFWTNPQSKDYYWVPNCIRLWNKQVFYIDGLPDPNSDSPGQTERRDRDLKIRCDRIDTMGIIWNGYTTGRIEVFPGYKQRGAFRIDAHRLFVDDDYVIFTHPRGYFVRSFRDRTTGNWLARAPRDQPQLIEGDRADSSSHNSPPRPSEPRGRTEMMVMYANPNV